jgi:hypothetical protein
MRHSGFLLVPLVFVLSAGCATSFSPGKVRSEIVRQTGSDPQKMFEMSVGRMTMSLARRVVGEPSGGQLPLAGLTKFELAVYDLPADVLSGARNLDFTLMPIRGWEPTMRYKDGPRSGMVLVRQSGESIGDLVLLFGGDEKATYVRLRGELPPELPAALGEAVRSGSTEAVERELQGLGGE